MRSAFMGTPVDILTFDETLRRIEVAMSEKKQCVHVALNVAKFVKLQDDEELRADVHGADIIGVDGKGIAWGMQWTGAGQVPRVSGVDLMMALLERCAKHGYRPYMLGAKEAVLAQAITNAKSKWPQLEFAGFRNGYFDAADEPEICAAINASDADCLFLAMPTPKKERFMAAHREGLNVPFVMGVGGSVDILAGHVKRAPGWMQKTGLEWFYRLYQEPRKMFRRYASTNGRFIWIVTRHRIKGSGEQQK